MRVGERVKGLYHKQKQMYKGFQNLPTLGQSSYNYGLKIGKKLSRIPKTKKYKVWKKRGRKLSNNINYYLTG